MHTLIAKIGKKWGQKCEMFQNNFFLREYHTIHWKEVLVENFLSNFR